ncbi:hypothetical protein [Streptomyces anulatus]|uniref:hypothetical protein n=1 Tax=Streptomyces anulatus TaxID=1892 RepID=UPI0034364823
MLELFAELQAETPPYPPFGTWSNAAVPQWEHLEDLRTPPISTLVETGSGRMNDKAMHGLYRRPVSPGADEVVAYWQGHLLWRWQKSKAAAALPNDALLSTWNLILAEGLSRLCDRSHTYALHDRTLPLGRSICYRRSAFARKCERTRSGTTVSAVPGDFLGRGFEGSVSGVAGGVSTLRTAADSGAER